MLKFFTWRQILVSIALALLIATELIDFWFSDHCFVLIQKDQSKWSEKSKTKLPNSAQIFSVQVKNQEKNYNVLCEDNFKFAFGSKSMKKSRSQKLFGRNFFWKKMLNFRNEKLSKKTENFLDFLKCFRFFFHMISKIYIWFECCEFSVHFFIWEIFQKKDRFFKKKLVFRLSFIILILTN